MYRMLVSDVKVSALRAIIPNQISLDTCITFYINYGVTTIFYTRLEIALGIVSVAIWI